MKALKLIAVFVAISLQSFGQTNIKIVIKNDGNHKIDKVDVFDLTQKEFFESPYNDTLNFVFKKQNIDCYNIRYHEKGKMYRQQVWLNSGEIKIEARIDSTKLLIDSVYNSPIYYENLNFEKKYSLLYAKNDTVSMNKMLLDYYSKNIDNLYSLRSAYTYIELNQNSKTNLLKLKTLTDKQGDKFSWFLLYPSVVERLDKILTDSAVNTNDYSFIAPNNKTVKIPPLSKKYYILDFWFLACAPCVKDHVAIKKNLELLDSKNVELISISNDTDVTKWQKYLSKHQYNWQNYLENGTNKLTQQLVIGMFPTYIVIDKSGNIVNRQNSFADLVNWLDKN